MVWLPLSRPQQLVDDAFVHPWHADCALEHRRLVFWRPLVVDADPPPLVVQLVYRQLPHQAPVDQQHACTAVYSARLHVYSMFPLCRHIYEYVDTSMDYPAEVKRLDANRM